MEEARQYPALNRRRLLAWAASIGPLVLLDCAARAGEDNALRPQGVLTADWAASRGPDDWHRLALFANWDFVEPAALRWIAVQPNCDRATALALFWKSQPDYFLEFPQRAAVPAVNRDGYDLVALIRERWQAGMYRRAELAFDRESDAGPVDFAALERRFGARVEQFMPVSMRGPLPGRRLSAWGIAFPGVIGG
jgi:Domain of unknown function (DUF4274)